KGGAGFLHLDALRDLAHDLESLLDAVRRSELRITSEVIDLVLAGADALKHFSREIGSQLQGLNAGTPIVVPTRSILQRVRAVLRGEPVPTTAQPPPPQALAPLHKAGELARVENTVQAASTLETPATPPLSVASAQSAQDSGDSLPK